jgi:hypothetical protein
LGEFEFEKPHPGPDDHHRMGGKPPLFTSFQGRYSPAPA